MQKTHRAKSPDHRVLTTKIDTDDRLSDTGVSYTEYVSRETVSALRHTRDREQASSLGLLLTAFGILLYRYTRGESRLAVRVSVMLNETNARAHSPFRTDRIARNYDVDLNLGDGMTLGQAICQVSQSLSAAIPPEAMPGLLALNPREAFASFEWREPGVNGAVVSATLSYVGRFVTELRYSNAAAMDAHALRIGEHWQTVLSSLSEDPETPIEFLPIIGDEERSLIVSTWKGEPHDLTLALDERLSDLFEAQSFAHPERIALQCNDSTLTYEELEERANKMARHLRSHGVTHGSKVGVFLPRSIDVYIAILGILKAGAAYVPIDPEYPADRVDYILNDCKVAALISTTGLSSILSTDDYELVDIDRDYARIDKESSERIEMPDSSPEDLAYIIYTSGSTGRPKGVQIEHRSACNLVRSEASIFKIRPEDKVFQGFSVAFDASVEEIWLAFFAGATLVVGTHEIVHAGPGLARILTEQGVTVLSCVPTLISMVEDDIPTLRLLILGGEQCPKDLVARWARKDRRVVNTYGPTEATVVATYANCHPGDPITIGRPIPNYFTYIVDAQLQAVPAGVPGELLLGGIGISRGYLNRPDLTEEKFIENPFTADDADAPERLYRTGDLVQYNSRGDIEYLGRIDAQVKLRGFRIELSEIESVLMTCPGIQSAVVSVREDIPGIQQLVAYIIPHQDRTFDESAVKSAIRNRLPAYMMPARFVCVRDFPTLPSGKVDRKRLPAPNQQVEEEAKIVAPARTDTEKALLKVWERLFQPQRVSIDDDFFELGGHSLLAARMVSELRKDQRFADVSMLDVYKHPVLVDLAAKLDENSASKSRDTEQPKEEFRSASKRSYYLCSIMQVVGIYLSIALFMSPWLASYRAYRVATNLGLGIGQSMLAAVGVSLLVLPFMLLMPVALKWLIIGKYKQGSYPLWGAYYWRFWFARRFQSMVPLTYLRGTPFLPMYLRLLGAKIGTNVYFGTQYVQITDLLTIGDDTSIGVDAQLPGYYIDKGMLHIGSISIGNRCFIGTKSVMNNNTVLEDDALLDEFSMIPSGVTVPEREEWAGSPASYVQHNLSDREPSRPESKTAAFIHGLLYAMSVIFFIPAVPMLAGLPSGMAILYLDRTHSNGWVLAAFPFATALFTVLLCSLTALLKRIVLPCMNPGEYNVHSLLHVRKWFVDSLMQVCLEMAHPLYATLYLPPWFRLLGVKLGRRVEISTVAHITPDLLSIGSESFIADSACIGPTRVHLGRMTVEQTSIGSRTFVGNSALIPAGTSVGDGYLIGVMSMPPSPKALEANPATSWLGSPSVLLPRRQESASFPESVIFNPPWYLYLVRGAIEFFRVTLPSSLFILTIGTFIHFSTLVYRTTSLAAVLCLYPAIYILSSCFTLGIAVAIKWLVMGKYRPCTRPLWSSFVWRTEMVTAIHECFAVPAFLNSLQGTPFLAPYFRLMGSKIGKRVLMETTQITEFDLVHIGDDASLNSNCTIQTHLFEDRVMKTSDLWIGDKSYIGPMAVALYDSEIQEGASLDGLSLLMKGENLPAWTRWEGIPARRHTRVSKPDAPNAAATIQ